MTVKEWLNRGYRLDKEINALIREQKRALELATKTTAPADCEKVQTSNGNTSEALFINYADYTKQEIITALDSVGDNILRQLLIHRYIEFKRWDSIAAEMCYSKRQVTRMHGKALLKIKDVLECHL